MAGVVVGAGLLVVCALTWIGFDEETQARFTALQRVTVLALGLGAFVLGFALTRSRVVAGADRLVVVNGYKRRDYDWAQIVAIRLPAGAPWVTLDLADGTTAAAMGIQGSDGDRPAAPSASGCCWLSAPPTGREYPVTGCSYVPGVQP